jgi:hypothetical protein
LARVESDGDEEIRTAQNAIMTSKQQKREQGLDGMRDDEKCAVINKK